MQGVGGRECNYFTWFDPPMCARSKMIIPGLLRKISDLEGEIHDMELKLILGNKVDQPVEGKKWKFWFVVAMVVAYILYIGA